MINYADYDKTHLERKSAILRICSDSLDDIPNCSAETVRLAENCIRHIHRDQPANQAMCYLLLPKLVKSQLQSEQFSLPFIQDLVVHGTESEFRKIRLATLEMIISLASNNFEFAQYAIGVFYDMFNDESELIRMKAVSFAIELNEKERNEISNDHFSRIQLILGDQSTEIRKLAYKLVKLLKFADSNKLIAAIRILSLNAERWSSDLESVYESLSCLPARNAGHIENAVRSLLNLNPPFIPPPLVVHDVSAKCIYVFVFNALQRNHKLQSIIPKSAIENHAYLYAVLKKHIPKPSSEPMETSGAIRNNLYFVAIKKLKKLSENIAESEYYMIENLLQRFGKHDAIATLFKIHRLILKVKSEGYLNGNGIIINEMKRILQNHQVASMELNDIGLKIERLNGSSNDIIDEIIEQIDKAIEKLLRVDLNGNSLNWNLIESENLKDIKRRRH